MEPHIAVVGGGISGLATAFYLQEESRQRDVPLRVSLFERGPRLGGVIRTEKVEGFLLEAGPEAFSVHNPIFLKLLDYLGLAEQLQAPEPNRPTLVLNGEGLTELPAGMSFLAPVDLRTFWKNAPLSTRGKLRSLAEPFVTRSRGDLSVRAFLERRLGSEFTNRLAAPLISAIYGSAVEELSARSSLPVLHGLEQKYGSLWWGLRQLARKRPAKSRKVSSPLLTLAGGMEQLVRRIEQRLKQVQVFLDAGDLKLELQGETIRILATDLQATVDRVVLCTPASASAEMLAPFCPQAATLLREIPTRSSRIVYLGYLRDGFEHPLNGSGFIVPLDHPSPLSACTWVSSKFAGRCPEDHVLLRCALHGSPNPSLSGQAAALEAHEEVARILKISSHPRFWRVYDYHGALPKLVVGHNDRMARIESLLASAPNLLLSGTVKGGVGVPDCVSRAWQTVSTLLDQLGEAASNRSALAAQKPPHLGANSKSSGSFSPAVDPSSQQNREKLVN